MNISDFIKLIIQLFSFNRKYNMVVNWKLDSENITSYTLYKKYLQINHSHINSQKQWKLIHLWNSGPADAYNLFLTKNASTYYILGIEKGKEKLIVQTEIPPILHPNEAIVLAVAEAQQQPVYGRNFVPYGPQTFLFQLLDFINSIPLQWLNWKARHIHGRTSLPKTEREEEVDSPQKRHTLTIHWKQTSGKPNWYLETFSYLNLIGVYRVQLERD